MTKTLDDLLPSLEGKRVLVRVDLNVPMAGGKVTDATRLHAVAPTVNQLADAGAKVVLLAHFGRPKGEPNPDMSLQAVAGPLGDVLGRPVAFAADCVGAVAADAIAALANREVILLENTRFYAAEEANDPDFSAALAKNGDAYVNDAFSAAHRAHASTEGLARLLPPYAGRAMQAELEALGKALGAPKRPVMAIVGGAKVSSKIALLENMVGQVDMLVVGGGMANTFLHANGVDVGKSLKEADFADTARAIMAAAQTSGCEIILPVDVVAAAEFAANAAHDTVPADQAVAADRMILDVGPDSIARVNAAMDRAATLVWNGPLGAFEVEPFDAATVACARYAAERTAAGELLTVAGGGDTAAALAHAGVAHKVSYLSTAGGAFLEWLEGKPLPGVEALKQAS